VINTRQFRQPLHLTAELKKQTQNLLNAGFIQRSNSLYNSPCFVIKKASGGYRYLVDLCGINQHIIKENEASINIEHVTLELSYKKPKFFSKIDSRSGFLQLSLHPDCREKTAFQTPLGKMEFAKLPMSLTSLRVPSRKRCIPCLRKSCLTVFFIFGRFVCLFDHH